MASKLPRIHANIVIGIYVIHCPHNWNSLMKAKFKEIGLTFLKPNKKPWGIYS